MYLLQPCVVTPCDSWLVTATHAPPLVLRAFADPSVVSAAERLMRGGDPREAYKRPTTVKGSAVFCSAAHG